MRAHDPRGDNWWFETERPGQTSVQALTHHQANRPRTSRKAHPDTLTEFSFLVENAVHENFCEKPFRVTRLIRGLTWAGRFRQLFAPILPVSLSFHSKVIIQKNFK